MNNPERSNGITAMRTQFQILSQLDQLVNSARHVVNAIIHEDIDPRALTARHTAAIDHTKQAEYAFLACTNSLNSPGHSVGARVRPGSATHPQHGTPHQQRIVSGHRHEPERAPTGDAPHEHSPGSSRPG